MIGVPLKMRQHQTEPEALEGQEKYVLGMNEKDGDSQYGELQMDIGG